MSNNLSPDPDQQMRAAIPLAVTAIRVLLAPLLVYWAWNGRTGPLFALCFFIGAGTDFLDGIVARRLGVATATVRRADSAADIVFYLAGFLSVWLAYPDVVRAHWLGLSLVVGLELIRTTVDLVKFRREASYHMLSAKVWNLTLFLAMGGLLGFGISGWLFKLPIVVGIISNLEGLAASLLLPTWTHDVPTVYHAYKISRER
ncbi:MAG: CDP-alcohol phosphatidyltransferase family protein [Anaerolineaceae bacterium]|nr:CDP-alcohol phosphatidyltransferase family protein [Anaerolineaceae bacterium]